MCNTKRIDWKKNIMRIDLLRISCFAHSTFNEKNVTLKRSKNSQKMWIMVDTRNVETNEGKVKKKKDRENFAYFVQFKFLMKQQHDLMRRVEEFTPLFFLSLYSSKFTPSLLYFSSFSAQLERLEKKLSLNFPLFKF